MSCFQISSWFPPLFLVLLVAAAALSGCSSQPRVLCHGSEAYVTTHRESSSIVRMARASELDRYCTRQSL